MNIGVRRWCFVSGLLQIVRRARRMPGSLLSLHSCVPVILDLIVSPTRQLQGITTLNEVTIVETTTTMLTIGAHKSDGKLNVQ